jgi:hypothetical protein
MVLVQESAMVLLLELAVQGLVMEMAQLRIEVEALAEPLGLFLAGKE